MLAVAFCCNTPGWNPYQGVEPGGDIYLWRETAKQFGADTVFVVDCREDRSAELVCLDSDFRFEVLNSVSELQDKGCLVILRPPSFSKETELLKNFSHPEEAIYLVGPDIGALDPLSGDFDITIGVGELFSFPAMVACLYDRFSKIGCR